MKCCEGVREKEVHEDIKYKPRRRSRDTSKTELSGAETEGGEGFLLTISAGQGELFGKEAM
jgi:hypothetical protein